MINFLPGSQNNTKTQRNWIDLGDQSLKTELPRTQKKEFYSSYRANQRRFRREAISSKLKLGNQLDMDSKELQELAEILHKYGPKSNPPTPALIAAAGAGDERAVKILIKYKAFHESDKSRAIDSAIFAKSLSLIKYFTEDLGWQSQNVLFHAYSNDFDEAFDYFLLHGYKIPRDLIGCIFLRPDFMRKVDFLLSRGGSLDHINERPDLLTLAITHHQNLELFRFLLNHGAYKKLDNSKWETHPLHLILCLQNGYNISIEKRIEYAQALADSGIQFSLEISQNIWGEFLQITYSKNGGVNHQKINLLKSLLKAGLSLNKFPSTQENALQYAIRNFRDYELIELMLQQGSDPNFKGNRNGYIERPLRTAIQTGDEKIIAILIRYGAKLDLI